MQHYIHIASKRYPLTAADIIAANPDKSFPIPFALPDGYAEVVPTEQPAHDPATHQVVEKPPKKVSGEWRQQWEVVALPPEQVAALASAAQEALLTDVRDEAQRRLDAFAQSRRYDGIISLASYATSRDPVHAAEGQRGVDLRDAVWAVLKDIEAAVLAGERAMPTFDEAVAELPELTWGDEAAQEAA